MIKFGVLLLFVCLAEASLKVSRSSRDGRHPSAMEIEVQLPYTGKTARLPLSRTTKYENVPMTVMNNGVSRTFSARQVHNPDHAHYNDIASTSVFSVRDMDGHKEFSGHFLHEGKSYFVEPQGKDHVIKDNPIQPKHLLQRMAEEQAVKQLKRAVSRKRRQTVNDATDYVVEITMGVDSTVWNAFKAIFSNETAALSEVHRYYTHIADGVNTVFRNIATPSISIEIIAFKLSQSAADDAWMPAASASNRLEGSVILESCKAYKATLSPQPDHFMAFTREDITGGGSNSVCGMAYMSGTCSDTGVSINEDQGLQSWGTAAHELAHNMGSPHDGDGNSCSAANQNIMAPSNGFYDLSNIANSYRLSPCSAGQVTAFVNQLSGGGCLKQDAGPRTSETSVTGTEGSHVTLDQVCKLAYPTGPGKFFISTETRTNPSLICAKIYCQTATGGGTATGGLRAPAGTACGDKKSCNWNGQCTTDNNAPSANESCFWGDAFSAADCAQWVQVVQYPDYKAAYCPYVKTNCCNSVGTACN